ncbi:hypothetical protein ACI65C_000167 [Semiaphis heraclei]
MATSSTFGQIWSGVQVEYGDNKLTADAPHTPPTQIVRRPSKPKTEEAQQAGYKWQIVWRNVIGFVILHSIAVYGFYLLFFGHVQIKTVLFMYVVAACSGLGITVGAHRLWAHRCYTARLPMRLLLAVFQTLAFQNHIYEWVRDHRVHHKFTDTDADPHNSSRGFFFSHMGWLMVRKHPDVSGKGGVVDMKDLEADPVVMWQKKYYLWLVPLVTFLIPSFIPYWLWQERFWYAFVVVGVTRYMISLHFTWLVNSAAHIWGTKPYDNTTWFGDLSYLLRVSRCTLYIPLLKKSEILSFEIFRVQKKHLEFKLFGWHDIYLFRHRDTCKIILTSQNSIHLWLDNYAYLFKGLIWSLKPAEKLYVRTIGTVIHWRSPRSVHYAVVTL